MIGRVPRLACRDDRGYTGASMFVFGWGPRTQLVRSELVACPDCRHQALRELERRYSVFHLFFIPLLSWGEHFTERCSRCLTERSAVRPEHLPPLPLADRLGLPVLIAMVALFAVVAGLATVRQWGNATSESVLARDPGHYEPTGERVLRRLEAELSPGAAKGVDAEARGLARAAHEALAATSPGSSTSDTAIRDLAVAGIIVLVPPGERHLVVLAESARPASTDRNELIATAHAVQRALAPIAAPEDLVYFALRSKGQLVLFAGGEPRGRWRMETDPQQGRRLLVEVLSY